MTRYDCTECDVEGADPGMVQAHVQRTGHEMVRTDDVEPPATADCDRCGADGPVESKVAIEGNYPGADVTWRPTCTDCIEKLGEFWSSGGAE